MSVDISRIDYPVKQHLQTKMKIPKNHFLVKLSESIPWRDYAELAIADLYKNKKRSGPKLNLRLHLGAFILQTLFRWTDRELEENLNFYAPAKIFCGIEDKAYDHSAYVKFRNRLSAETAKKFNVKLLKVAIRKGFTGSQFMDFDSTVQEANIEYPSDMRMMQSLLRKTEKILNDLIEKGSRKAKEAKESLNLKGMGKLFKSYFFAKKSEKGFELKVKLFSSAQRKAKKAVDAIISLENIIKKYQIKWNIKRDLKHVTKVGPALLKQIRHFINNGTVAAGKILSLHAEEVKCISKGKAGTPHEFGRKFFIGRLPGNYAIAFSDEVFALEDAYSLERGLEDFKDVFDSFPQSISGDQGFWSRPNLKACKERDIKEVGINPRGHKNWKIPENKIIEIQSRRSKVEPVIGHLKRRGLGKSKMRSDKMTKLAGQRSALSLNLSRLARDLSGEKLKWAG